MVGISAVDGSGHLGVAVSGMAEWLMMPYSFAAPIGDTQYNVGGTLSYIVGAVNFSVPLLPDTITVKPTPSLIVHYFLEKYVRGDDPLTQIVEPVIPFTLAIMVMNDGYGVAHALKLTSAQPEIIENTKGLLVAFKILGTEIGNKHMQPSMTVHFGDIEPFETKTARWLLECPLKGTFSNYSATFENVNPLGDPQLSLLDELDYHELVHRVKIQNSPSGAGAFDNLDDYLVNDELDDAEFPDRLYNSANGSDIQPVLPSIVKNFALHKTVLKSSSKAYTVVLLRVSVNSSAWYYTRVINNLTSSVPQDDQLLIQVFREDGKNILVEKNAWQTTHILHSFLYHMLDYSNHGENEEAEISYYLTFGPRNMYPPKFNSSEYSGIVSADAPNGTTVIKLAAYDIDGDSYSFKLGAHNVSIFSIYQTGEVKVSGLLSRMGLVTIEAIVEDDGIPARSSIALITIEVRDEASLLLSTVPMPGNTYVPQHAKICFMAYVINKILHSLLSIHAD